MGLLNGPGMSDLYSHIDATRNWRGSYLGFTFNGIHSSDMGIVRTSSGDRYDEELLPQMQDKIVTVPGMDGSYFFGSNYSSRIFNIPIAFDNLTDQQFKRLRTIFGDKKIHDLIFDEMPYKVYHAKVTSQPTIKQVCFDAELGQRVYRGEGTIQFTAYFPFATSRYKYITDYTLENIPEWNYNVHNININEWREGSGIREQGIYDKLYGALPSPTSSTASLTHAASIYTDEFVPQPGSGTSSDVAKIGNGQFYGEMSQWYLNDDTNISSELPASYVIVDDTFISNPTSGSYIITYNPGDVETDWRLKIPLSNIASGGMIKLASTNVALELSGITLHTGESYIIIDSKTNLIEGYNNSGLKTGTIYNQYIASGEFFKIPLGVDHFILDGFGLSPTTSSWEGKLDYDYLYF